MAKVYSAPEGMEAPDFVEYIHQGVDFAEGLDALNEAERAYIARLAQMARGNGTSPLLGKELRWQRGDGFARYMVWRTRPLELIHLELGDAWSVEPELIRGLRVSDVQRMVAYDKRVADLFAGRG